MPVYLQALRLVLANANSLMFIDPHLDPTRAGYRDFVQLLLASRRAPVARLEVHKVCYEGSGSNRIIFTGPGQAELEQSFRNSWATDLRNAGIVAQVHVWPDFHDRYLITDLMGIMRRYERASTLLTSNRPVEDWGKLLGDAAAVSAMLDRILHHGHVLKCGPRSWRTKLEAPPQ